MTLHGVLVSVMSALRPLVGNRVTTFVFPQGGKWPAIRVSVISATPAPDLCGDGGDEGADFRLQLDVVTESGAGETAHGTLRAQVMAAMANIGPHVIWDGQFSGFDEPTRTFRTSLDYMIFLST